MDFFVAVDRRKVLVFCFKAIHELLEKDEILALSCKKFVVAIFLALA